MNVKLAVQYPKKQSEVLIFLISNHLYFLAYIFKKLKKGSISSNQKINLDNLEAYEFPRARFKFRGGYTRKGELFISKELTKQKIEQIVNSLDEETMYAFVNIFADTSIGKLNGLISKKCFYEEKWNVFQNKANQFDSKQNEIFREKNMKNSDDTFQYKILKYVSIFLILFTFFTCSSRKRIGAKCRDGSTSYSTGSGTCSHHNGVRSWKYEYWWE